MTTYGVNQASASTGNPLCDKLKRQFAARGIAKTAQYKAPSTSVMIERVQRGLDPYEHAPNPLLEKRAASVHTKTAAQSRPAVNPTERSRAKAVSVKSAQAAKAAPVKSARTSASKQDKALSPFGTEVKQVRSAAAAAREAKAKTRMEEVRIARAPFPFAALITATIFTFILLSVMFAFVQNYELSGEISKLQAERDAIIQEQEILALRLEERDDIRVIEDIAVNKIGMVKNDLIENRFVSISGGNRVELSENTEEESEENDSVFSGMLSAIGENFAKIREYID